MPDKSEAGTLLLIDDEPLNRELLRRVLQRSYHVEEAEDAAQALTLLEESADQVSLILCDQLMPGKSGTQLAAIVRERWPGIRFLLLTGYDEDDAVKAAMEGGIVWRVLGKPWRSSALKQIVEEALAKEG